MNAVRAIVIPIVTCFFLGMAGCGSTNSSEPPPVGIGSWQPMRSAPADGYLTTGAAVWTGSEMLVFRPLDRIYRYEPEKDTWSDARCPYASRGGASAVWTGDRLILWGGVCGMTERGLPAPCVDGGMFEPKTGTWFPITTNGAPQGRQWHTAIWATDRMIVWGGLADRSVLNDGKLYDPAKDAWEAMPDSGLSTRQGHTAVWAGDRMIVWGGELLDDTSSGIGAALNDGAAFVMPTRTWTRIAKEGAPSARLGTAAVWTGSEMIVWGGRPGPAPNGDFDANAFIGDGAAYDPKTNRWRPLGSQWAPSARTPDRAVWTGTEMLVWGGFGKDGYLVDGARYNPATDTWRPMTTTGAPSARSGAFVFWTGARMLVWGGSIDAHQQVLASDGAMYLP